MYLDCLSAIVSQNRLNPIMQRAKNDRSVLRALPVYDNADTDNEKTNVFNHSRLNDYKKIQAVRTCCVLSINIPSICLIKQKLIINSKNGR